jgi:hypothetical protein
MTTINDGGPAFPRHAYDGHDGMSLRDWFAGQALAGLLREGIDIYGTGDTAVTAYKVADAMLRVREVKP